MTMKLLMHTLQLHSNLIDPIPTRTITTQQTSKQKKEENERFTMAKNQTIEVNKRIFKKRNKLHKARRHKQSPPFSVCPTCNKKQQVRTTQICINCLLFIKLNTNNVTKYGINSPKDQTNLGSTPQKTYKSLNYPTTCTSMQSTFSQIQEGRTHNSTLHQTPSL